MNLLICDYDNTFKVHLNSIKPNLIWRSKDIYDWCKSYLSVKTAKEKGAITVLATGRDLNSIKRDFDKSFLDLDCFDYLCCEDGAIIYNSKKEKIYFKPINELREIEIRNILDEVQCEYTEYSYMDTNQVLRIVIRCISEKIKNYLIERLSVFKDLKVTHDSTELQVVSAYASKSKAVKEIIDLIGSNIERVVCFGDGENDIELFEQYEGYAMRWACSKIRLLSNGLYDSLSDAIENTMFNEYNYNYFRFSDDELEYVQKIIKVYKTKYDIIKSEYVEKENFNNESFQLCNEIQWNKSYCAEIQILIKDIIRDIHFFDGYDIDIVLTGSLSRNTAKSFSDIDISVFYDNRYFYSIRKYEELFYYVLMCIFGLNRRSIHSVLMANSYTFDNVQNESSYEDYWITITSPQYTIKYFVEKNTADVVLRVDKNPRDFESLRDDVIKLIRKGEWHEWYVNWVLLRGSEEKWLNFHHQIIKEKNSNIDLILSNHKKNCQELLCAIKGSNIKTVGEFKKLLQMDTCMIIYDGLSIMGNEKVEDLSAREYLHKLRKVAKKIKQNGFWYSSHIYELFPISMIEDLNDIRSDAIHTIRKLCIYEVNS